MRLTIFILSRLVSLATLPEGESTGGGFTPHSPPKGKARAAVSLAALLKGEVF